MLRLPQNDDLPEDFGNCLPGKVGPFAWYFIRQVKWFFVLIILLNLMTALLSACAPLFVKIFVDEFSKIDDPIPLINRIEGPFIIFLVFVIFVKSAAQLISSWLRAQVFSPFEDMMRRQVALYMHGHCYSYFQNDFSGRLAGKVIETPYAILQLVEIVSMPFLSILITCSLYFAFMYNAHPYFFAVMIVWAMGYGLLLCLLVPGIVKISNTAFSAKNVLRGRFVDTLSNILQVKLFARRDFEDKYLIESLKETTGGFRKVYMKFFQLHLGLQAGNGFLWAASMFLAIYLYEQGKISTGDVAMVLPVVISLSNFTWWVSEMSVSFFQRLGEIKEGIDTITTAHDVVDRKGAGELQVKEGLVEFDHVNFTYGSVPVLNNLSIKIKPGQKLGIVGPSGAGKSTFVQLILRLYDIQDGIISIDGHNIAEVQQESLRSNIAVIPQLSDLLHRTVMDNIRYGRLGATDEEVIEAAKKAHAHEFILSLEDKDGNKGYDVKVGERGVKLSGGQRQRIAIARAMLKNAPILVLDEATSSLDSESEMMIQESLAELMKGRTVIAIAHRLSTIAHMDRLIVMDEGKIVEDGSHLELLLKEGLYARMWRMQSGGFIISPKNE